MSRFIFQQPNGKVGFWSTEDHAILKYNLTKEDYIKIRLEEYKEEVKLEANKVFDEEPNGDPTILFEDLRDNFVKMPKKEFKKILKEINSNCKLEDFRFEEDYLEEK